MLSRFSPLALAVAAGLLAAVCPGTGWGDEFSDMAATMGTATTLIGVHQTTTTTTDANGVPISINFWAQNPAAYEGALAYGSPPVPLSNPHMAQADAYGNIYIADKASHAVLKITTDGRVHTFAGTHAAGFNGDGPAPANTLQLNNTNGLFVFPDGTVYLLDPGNHRIRRVTPDGVMTTIVNDPEPNWYPSGRALWVSPNQQLIYYTNEFAPLTVGGIADGACLKRWTPGGGIELICQKSVGFRNPANCAVNPVDGKLYICDRAEEEAAPKVETGIWRIDGIDLRTRMTAASGPGVPPATDGLLAINCFVEQPRGIAFLPNGAYFFCTHKAIISTTVSTSDVWYVDTAGILHKFIQGKGNKDDSYNIGFNHPQPFNTVNNLNQARAVSIAPNGSLLVVCNDSGYVFRVNNLVPHLPADLHSTHFGADGLRLSWSGLFSRGYLIQRTGSLAPPSWQTIGAAGGFPTGVPSEFLDPAATGQSADFYRLAPAQ